MRSVRSVTANLILPFQQIFLVCYTFSTRIQRRSERDNIEIILPDYCMRVFQKGHSNQHSKFISYFTNREHYHHRYISHITLYNVDYDLQLLVIERCLTAPIQRSKMCLKIKGYFTWAAIVVSKLWVFNLIYTKQFYRKRESLRMSKEVFSITWEECGKDVD